MTSTLDQKPCDSIHQHSYTATVFLFLMSFCVCVCVCVCVASFKFNRYCESKHNIILHLFSASHTVHQHSYTTTTIYAFSVSNCFLTQFASLTVSFCLLLSNSIVNVNQTTISFCPCSMQTTPIASSSRTEILNETSGPPHIRFLPAQKKKKKKKKKKIKTRNKNEEFYILHTDFRTHYSVRSPVSDTPRPHTQYFLGQPQRSSATLAKFRTLRSPFGYRRQVLFLQMKLNSTGPSGDSW